MPQKELSDDASRSLPRKQVALVLQGGGALGAYQAGVYECLSESPYAPDWVAGISIGAINAAIIAGNPPAERAAKLRMFWEGISETSAGWPNIPGQAIRNLTRQAGSVAALFFGAPGFFRPSAYADLLRGRAPTSFYDTSDLKLTLERLVDFDRINAREVRLSLGAVDVETGNFAYFDNAYMPIRPEHVRFRRGSRPWKSKAAATGTVVSFPTRRCNTCSIRCLVAARSPFRSISSPPTVRSP
jgi:NTE family protein